jgi:mRNA interferase RelE/StbE
LTYKVEFDKKAKKEFDRLPLEVQIRFLPKIEALANDPRPPGSRALSGQKGSYRIREGDFRALYTIHDDIVLVLVFRVENRKDAYRNL